MRVSALAALACLAVPPATLGDTCMSIGCRGFIVATDYKSEPLYREAHGLTVAFRVADETLVRVVKTSPGERYDQCTSCESEHQRRFRVEVIEGPHKGKTAWIEEVAIEEWTDTDQRRAEQRQVRDQKATEQMLAAGTRAAIGCKIAYDAAVQAIAWREEGYSRTMTLEMLKVRNLTLPLALPPLALPETVAAAFNPRTISDAKDIADAVMSLCATQAR